MENHPNGVSHRGVALQKVEGAVYPCYHSPYNPSGVCQCLRAFRKFVGHTQKLYVESPGVEFLPGEFQFYSEV